MALSLTTALSKIVKEELAPTIREMRIKLDPVWSEIFVSSQGVKTEGLGRDWKYKFPCVVGLSGAYQFSDAAFLTGADLAYGPVTEASPDNSVVFGAGKGFPTRIESTAPSFFDITMTLKEARGNIFMPLKWMQMDQFDSIIGSAVRKVMEGSARKVALMHAVSFYTKDNAKFPIVWNLPRAAAAGTATITIDNSSSTLPNGRIQMVHNGMLVDIIDTAGTTKRNDGPWMVTNVSYLENKFTIKKTMKYDGSGVATDVAIGNNAADTDFITFARATGAAVSGTWTAPNQPGGLMSNTHMMGDTPHTIYQGNLDVALHPEYGSYIVTNLNGPLTEKVLTKYLGMWKERIGTMTDLDTLLMSAGVVHAYLENEDNLARYERNGRRLSIKGGWADIDYAYQGSPFRFAVSSFIEPKAVVGIKTGGQNWKELVPPGVPGTGSQGEFENEIKFFGPLAGYKGIWQAELATVNTNFVTPTDMFMAPYYRICELYEEWPQKLVIRGVDESTAN